jgi:hypothetical protein
MVAVVVEASDPPRAMRPALPSLPRPSDYARQVMTEDLAQQQKEWFSRAFVVAVSSAAGYTVSWQADDVYGVDVVVRWDAVPVDFQLKATASPEYGDGCLKFDLDVPTYDKLRDRVRGGPGYLLVAVIPENVGDWLKQQDDELLLRHRAFWIDLTGQPSTDNTTKVRVYLPLGNLLDVEALHGIMARARERLLNL